MDIVFKKEKPWWSSKIILQSHKTTLEPHGIIWESIRSNT